MDRITTRVAAAAAVGLALLAAGCSGNNATAAGTNATPVSAASRALPSPFTITARYTAVSPQLVAATRSPLDTVDQRVPTGKNRSRR